MYVCTRGSSWNSASSTLEPARPQYNRSATCVIAEQYSSATFVSSRFHSRKKKFSIIFKKCCFFYFSVRFENFICAILNWLIRWWFVLEKTTGIADKTKLLIAFWTHVNRSCESVHRVYLCSGLNEMTNVMEQSPPWVFQLLSFSLWTQRLIIAFINPTTKPYPMPVESIPSHQASLKVLFNTIAMLTFRFCEQNFASIFNFCLACYKYPILPSLTRSFPCFLRSTTRKRGPLTLGFWH